MQQAQATVQAKALTGQRPQQAGTTDAARASPPLLYADALRSIFVFSSLAELQVLVCVSRAWQSAVLGVAPRGLSLELSVSPLQMALLPVCMSPLGRHVGALSHTGDLLEAGSALGAFQLGCVVLGLRNLRSMQVRLAADVAAAPLQLPSQLRSFTLQLSAFGAAPALQRVVDGIATLRQLSHWSWSPLTSPPPPSLLSHACAASHRCHWIKRRSSQSTYHSYARCRLCAASVFIPCMSCPPRWDCSSSGERRPRGSMRCCRYRR